eukprot:1065125-Rhodomonas_salina.2
MRVLLSESQWSSTPCGQNSTAMHTDRSACTKLPMYLRAPAHAASARREHVDEHVDASRACRACRSVESMSSMSTRREHVESMSTREPASEDACVRGRERWRTPGGCKE